MHLFCISDLHGRIESLDRMSGPAEEADIFIVSGDITNFGKKRAAEDVVGRLLKLNDNLLAVPGNCDTPEVNDVLEEQGLSLHGRSRIWDDVAFFGIGGSTVTPFGTPQEYREERLGELLRRGYGEIKGCNKKVLVSHTPPWGTRVDLTRAGLHVGSRAVRSFLEENSVALVICGHIHEARGEDILKEARIVNPGPGHMGYAVIRLGNGVSVELMDLD
jgi:hypothetical protein